MANYIYLNDILAPLSFSLGEESIPANVPASRIAFVQYGLERIARLYEFDWQMQVFTVTLTNGAGTLDSSIRVDAKMDVRQVVSGSDNDNVFEEVTQADFDNWNAGDFKYYISYSPGSTGIAPTITTTEALGSIQVTASLAAPTISNSVGVTFPSAKIASDFALVFLRRGEDKDADTIVEEAIALQGLQELIAAEQRNNPTGRAKNRYDRTGHYTGEVPTTLGVFWNTGSV
jgi:hypothetical protein